MRAAWTETSRKWRRERGPRVQTYGEQLHLKEKKERNSAKVRGRKKESEKRKKKSTRPSRKSNQESVSTHRVDGSWKHTHTETQREALKHKLREKS